MRIPLISLCKRALFILGLFVCVSCLDSGTSVKESNDGDPNPPASGPMGTEDKKDDVKEEDKKPEEPKEPEEEPSKNGNIISEGQECPDLKDRDCEVPNKIPGVKCILVGYHDCQTDAQACNGDDPNCRDRHTMPPETKCSEITNDNDCELPGKIQGKSCRLFKAHDCRQVANCGDITVLGEHKCHGTNIMKEKYCEWHDAQCKEITVLPVETLCTGLNERDCQVPNKIPQKYCRMFQETGCQEIKDCSGLTPLGVDACHGNINGAYCGWAGNGCQSYIH